MKNCFVLHEPQTHSEEQHSHIEQVFSKHFVLGKPFPYWHKHNVGWVPNLGLRKKTSECKIYYELKAKREERAKIREKHSFEQQ